MDRLWLIGLLGWVVRCIHACGKDVASRFSRLFDLQYPQPLLKILKSHAFPPTVLKFNPTSRLLISGSADNTVRLIAIPEGLGDSCAYYFHLIIYWFELTVGPLSLSASWSYTLMIVLALFVVLFALTVQLFMRGAI